MLGLSSAEFPRHSTTVARPLSNSGTQSALSGHPGNRFVQGSAASVLGHSGARTLRCSFAPVLGHSDAPPLPRLGLSKARALQCSGASVLGRSGAWLLLRSVVRMVAATSLLCQPTALALGAQPLILLGRSVLRHSATPVLGRSMSAIEDAWRKASPSLLFWCSAPRLVCP